MKKCLLSFLLCLCTAAGAWAETVIDGIKYELDVENSTATVTGADRSLIEIVIPATVASEDVTYSVTSIGDNAFGTYVSITSVTIPESVTSIGKLAFNRCRSLGSITVSIGNEYYDSRNDCNAIIETATNTLVTGCANTIIPESVTGIGDSAFFGCGIMSVTIPASVTSIGMSAFDECRGLGSITVSIGNEYYDSRNDCNAIIETSTNTLVTGGWKTIIPATVTSIGDHAFRGRDFINTNLTIPASVTSIGDYAFCTCWELASITIPASVTSIGDYAFFNCSGLTSIPVGVTSIGEHAFESCYGLTDITIPGSLTSIGDYVFYDCSSLTSVTIPESVTSIGSSAFESCSSLTSITIPESVASIEYSAFQGCTSLTDITIPESVTSIKMSAFHGCSSLTNLTIPAFVTSIGRRAFSGCGNLKEVRCMGDTPARCDDGAFDGSTCEQGTLYVPKGASGAYKEAEVWKEFQKIVEFIPTGIDGIAGDGNGKPQPIYDLQGRRQPQPQRGLNIIGGRKVLVK